VPSPLSKLIKLVDVDGVAVVQMSWMSYLQIPSQPLLDAMPLGEGERQRDRERERGGRGRKRALLSYVWRRGGNDGVEYWDVRIMERFLPLVARPTWLCLEL
jgi:hypothetical protein